jgi:hypothetical protein
MFKNKLRVVCVVGAHYCSEPTRPHHHRFRQLEVKLFWGSEAHEAFGNGERGSGFLLLVVGNDFGELMGKGVIVEEQREVRLGGKRSVPLVLGRVGDIIERFECERACRLVEDMHSHLNDRSSRMRVERLLEQDRNRAAQALKVSRGYLDDQHCSMIGRLGHADIRTLPQERSEFRR